MEVTVRGTATRFLNRRPTTIPRLPDEVSECRGETDSIELTLGLHSLYECLVKGNGFGEVFQRLSGVVRFLSMLNWRGIGIPDCLGCAQVPA